MNYEHVLEALFYTAWIVVFVFFLVALPAGNFARRRINKKEGRQGTYYRDLSVSDRGSVRGTALLALLLGTVVAVAALLPVWLADFANEDADREAEAIALDQAITAINADVGGMDGVRILSLRLNEGILHRAYADLQVGLCRDGFNLRLSGDNWMPEFRSPGGPTVSMQDVAQYYAAYQECKPPD